MQARYDYDPYGRRTKLSGSVDADLGYAGHYAHLPTGPASILFRALQFSEDPFGSVAGI